VAKGKTTKDKKYYWIKLKTDFFRDDGAIDFIMGQKNGSEYVALYIILCLKTANQKGELSTMIGNLIIPYDIDKIVRDTKYFDFDTVKSALELFEKFGLIEKKRNSEILKIAYFDEMVGSETEFARKKREQRIRQKELEMREISSEDSLTEEAVYLQFDSLTDYQKKIIKNDWLTKFSIESILVGIEVAKTRVVEVDKLFPYVSKMIENKSIAKYSSEKIELVDYKWWLEE